MLAWRRYERSRLPARDAWDEEPRLAGGAVDDLERRHARRRELRLGRWAGQDGPEVEARLVAPDEVRGVELQEGGLAGGQRDLPSDGRAVRPEQDVAACVDERQDGVARVGWNQIDVRDTEARDLAPDRSHHAELTGGHHGRDVLRPDARAPRRRDDHQRADHRQTGYVSLRILHDVLLLRSFVNASRKG